MDISLVPIEYVDTYWHKIEDFLDGAAKYTYGRFTVMDIYDTIKNGSTTLWAAYEGNVVKGAVVTNMLIYPRKKMLCMQFCGGIDLEQWKDHMLDVLRQYAKANDCNGIEATARPGWAKIFKEDGHQSCWSTFELPL